MRRRRCKSLFKFGVSPPVPPVQAGKPQNAFRFPQVSMHPQDTRSGGERIAHGSFSPSFLYSLFPAFKWSFPTPKPSFLILKWSLPTLKPSLLNLKWSFPIPKPSFPCRKRSFLPSAGFMPDLKPSFPKLGFIFPGLKWLSLCPQYAFPDYIISFLIQSRGV